MTLFTSLPCMCIYCGDVIDSLSSVWVQGSVITERIIPLYLPTSKICPFLHQTLIAFSRCNQSSVFCIGEGVWLPLSVGFCILVNLMSVGNMVCRRDDVAGSISQNTPGIFSILSPCQNEKAPACVSPSNVARAACSSCLCRQLSPYLMLLLSVPVLWNQLQRIVKTVLSTIFAHWGWDTSSLIGSCCYIIIFSWETLVAKQFRNRKKFKAFMLIRHTWLETYCTLTVKASNVW